MWESKTPRFTFSYSTTELLSCPVALIVEFSNISFSMFISCLYLKEFFINFFATNFTINLQWKNHISIHIVIKFYKKLIIEKLLLINNYPYLKDKDLHVSISIDGGNKNTTLSTNEFTTSLLLHNIKWDWSWRDDKIFI